MFQFVLRSIPRSTVPTTRCILSRSSPMLSSKVTFTSRRTFASQPEGGDIIAEFTQKVQNNPSLGEAIMRVQGLLQQKGIDPSKGTLSPMQYVTIFKDKDIRESFETLSSEMKKADIKFSKDQIDSLMKVLGLEK